MSRELDVQVAKALGQSEPPTLRDQDYWWSSQIDGTWYGERWLDTRSWQEVEWPPHYRTNIAVAWELVELMVEDGARPGLIYDDFGHWAFAEWGGHDITMADSWPVDMLIMFMVRQDAWCDTPAEAICHAFLAWKEANDG